MIKYSTEDKIALAEVDRHIVKRRELQALRERQMDTTLSDMEKEAEAKVVEEDQALVEATIAGQVSPQIDKEDDTGELWGQGLQNLIRAGANVFDMIEHINKFFTVDGKHKRLVGEDYKALDYSVIADSIRVAIEKMDIKQPTGQYAEKPERLHRYLTDPKRFTHLVATNAPTTAALAMTTVVAPYTAIAAMFAIEGGETAKMVREYEKEGGEKLNPAGEAFAPFVIGAINAALEKTGIDAILKSFGGGKTVIRALKRVLFTAGIEGGTEGMQEANQVLAELFVTNKLDPDYAHRIVAGAVAGLGSGGGIAAPGVVTGMAQDRLMQARQERVADAFQIIGAKKRLETLMPKKEVEAVKKPAPAKEPAPEVTEDKIIKALTAQGFPSEEIVRMSAAERHEAYDKKKKYEAPKEEKVARPVKPIEAAEREKAKKKGVVAPEPKVAKEPAPQPVRKVKEEVAPVEELTAEKRANVTAHVEEQQSYKDVVDLYPSETEVDKFARERGREKFGIAPEEVKPAVTPKVERELDEYEKKREKEGEIPEPEKRYAGLPVPDFIQDKINLATKKLFGKPEGIERKSWEITKDYWGKRWGVEWKYSDKWHRELKKTFSTAEREDMMFYRQRTGNLWKGKEDTFEDVQGRLTPEAKEFVDQEIDEHISNWRKIWNESPFTKDINAREEVIKTYLTGVYAGDVKKAYEYLVGLKGKSFVTRNFMLNKKTYLNFAEAFKEAGLVPRFRDMTDQLNYQDAHMVRLLANNELIGQIHELEKEIGQKLIARSNQAKLYDQAKAEEWILFDDPWLRAYVAGRKGKKGEKPKPAWATTRAPALVHPELASAIQGVFTKDAFKPENILWRGYDAVGAHLRYVRVSCSGFHFVPLAESLLGGKGFGVLNFPAWIKRGREILDDPVLMQELVESGVRLRAPSEVSRHQVEGNIKALINVLEAQGGLKKVAAQPIKAITWLPFHITDFMFGPYLSILKANIFFDYQSKVLKGLEKQGKKLDTKEMKEINREVASLVNDQFGVQAWELMRTFNDPTIRKWMHRAIGYPDWCSIWNTRAMTKTGWKYHYELSVGDEIMVFDPNAQKLKWSRLEDKYVNEDYTGEMIQVKNQNRSIMITPDHTCYVTHNRNKKARVVKAKALSTHCLIPRIANFDTPDEEIYDDYFITIVGWIVTDGHILRRQRKKKDGTHGNSLVAKITQSKPYTVEILKELGLSYYVEDYNSNHDKFVMRYPKHAFHIPSKVVAKLGEIGINENNKSLSWEFLSKLTQRQLKLLYDTMMLGDGTGQNRFCGREREVFYMTMLQTMLGLPSTFYQQEKSCWRTRRITSKNVSCHRRASIDYSGTVWCPSVDTGFWLAEREGLIFVTGNSISALRQAKAIGEPGIRGRLGRWYWFRYGIAFVAMQNAMSYLFTGLYNDEDDENKIKWSGEKAHSTFANKDPKHPLNFQLPDIEMTVQGVTFNPGRDDKGRRKYAHFGKQMLEIPRYVTDFTTQMFSKSNPVIQLIFTQLLGGKPYKGEIFPARGEYVAGEFKPWKGAKPWTYERMKERLLEAVTSSLPFSIQQIRQMGPATAGILPISKGLSLYISRDYMQKAVEHQDKEMLENIRITLRDNGYEEASINRTMGIIKSDYYNKALQAADKKDSKQCVEHCISAIMLGAKQGNFVDSINRRGKEISRETRKFAIDSFREARKKGADLIPKKIGTARERLKARAARARAKE